MRRLVHLFVGFGAVASLSGCWWTGPGYGPDRRAHNNLETAFAPNTVDQFVTLWTATTDATAPQGVSHPVTSDVGYVHVTSATTAYAFDPATGATVWSDTPSNGFPIDTDYYAHSSTNLLLASYEVSPNNWRPIQWSTPTGDFVESELNGRIDSVTANVEALFVTFSNGVQSFSLFPTGFGGTTVTDQPDLANRMTLGPEQVFHSGVGVGTPAGHNGVRAWDRDTRALLWATEIDGTRASSPVLSVDHRTTYVGTDAGTIYAVDTATGVVEWSSAVGSAVSAPPALADGALFVPTASGSLVVLDAAGCGSPTCAPDWTTAAGATIGVQPAVGGGVVFVGDADGGVRGYDADGCGAATCPALWDEDTGSATTGAPAISLGRVFVGTQDGRLIAYGLPG